MHWLVWVKEFCTLVAAVLFCLDWSKLTGQQQGIRMNKICCCYYQEFAFKGSTGVILSKKEEKKKHVHLLSNDRFDKIPDVAEELNYTLTTIVLNSEYGPCVIF